MKITLQAYVSITRCKEAKSFLDDYSKIASPKNFLIEEDGDIWAPRFKLVEKMYSSFTTAPIYKEWNFRYEVPMGQIVVRLLNVYGITEPATHTMSLLYIYNGIEFDTEEKVVRYTLEEIPF